MQPLKAVLFAVLALDAGTGLSACLSGTRTANSLCAHPGKNRGKSACSNDRNHIVSILRSQSSISRIVLTRAAHLHRKRLAEQGNLRHVGGDGELPGQHQMPLRTQHGRIRSVRLERLAESVRMTALRRGDWIEGSVDVW